MNVSQLIKDSSQDFDSEDQFLIHITKRILNDSPTLSSLKISDVIIKELVSATEKIIPETNSLLTRKKQLNLRPFEQELQIQKKILSCPEIDDCSVFLAGLKRLQTKQLVTTYTPALRELLKKNIHKIHAFDLETDIIGRGAEKDAVMRGLNKTERNNVIITGNVGVGKTALAKDVLQDLKTHRPFQLFPGSDTLEDQILNIVASTETAPVFFLDEIFSFEVGQINFLIDQAQVIGTANELSLRKFSAEHPGLLSKFDVITLEDPKGDTLTEIVDIHKQRVSQKTGVFFEDKTTEEVIKLSKQFITELSFPAKAIALLEESAEFTKNQGESLVTEATIKAVVSQKVNIPISSLTNFDAKDMSNLDERLLKRVKGQDHAIVKLARSIQRARLGLNRKQKPIGSFLFVGPSGVGKTELTKALANEVFGDDDSMIRIDMSEYTEAHTVQRLIGAPPGYIGFEEGGQLTNPVKQKPFSLVLLDEIEKAHPKVFDIFLQVLDDGRLTDGRGKVVDFTNTIIVATSNAGIEDILDLIEEGKEDQEIEKEIKDIMQDYFRIEFLNRFDDIIVFRALKPEALRQIAEIHVQKLVTELSIRGITLSVSPETIDKLGEAAYDPRYGARGLLRLIQEKIENSLVEMIVNNQIKPGDEISF